MLYLSGDAELIRRLDDLLWLRGYAGSSMNRQDLDRAYSLAVVFGRKAAEKTPISGTADPREFDAQLFSHGIKAITAFSETGESGRFTHAYYDENTQAIAYDEAFAAEVIGISGGKLPWNAEEIRRALLLHELFHHLETTNIGLTYEFIRGQTGRRPPKASRNLWRDIAAFAFVHAQRPAMSCQLLDLCWLKRHAPERYAALLPDIRRVMPRWNI